MSGFMVKNVSMVYDGDLPTITLQDINLQVRDGEFLCILGPSGCGKSTLLELLAGLQLPTEGEIWLDDAKIKGPTRRSGVVFQDASLYPWRTISQNVGLGLELGGMKKAERQALIDKYLNMVGLQGFGSKYPHHLSGGMRQRAGIARALVNSPNILLMDEPFGAVDHLTRLQLQQDLLRIWQEEKKTVVFVTHDVSEAVFLADRVVLLSPRPGRIHHIFDVPYERPRKREDASLLKIQNDIYSAIYDVKTEEDLEFTI
ncbi:ABC transporter ATP-binding protein [Paenibacillus sp. ISL-20]|uniref:ABC transporter ATP-binding protein n=1 Tax=Paenibacillus sp. ISL-20 TaxID=2819163 RepID=UPI001BECE7E5|nr:ABC transporter ATP-binding protein [Paenibacillus sp. ISL-20]MBT2762529.1 ABC transporter ATP-binding protein [Paenibacillus sp. ISL-20]